MISIYILSIIGCLVSCYAVYVEKKSEKKGYHAVCDINDRVSCTKAFKSEYGKMFGVSNGISGILFYLAIIALSILNLTDFIFYLSVVSIIGSIYLWYVLTFKVKAVCIVCYSIYLVNLLLLIFSYLN